MPSLKIIHCLVFYLPVRIGGIEIYVQALLRELKDKGHQVKIIVPFYKGEIPYPSEDNGIPILTYPEFSNSTRREFSGDAPGKGLKGFIKCLEDERPDIVHFHQLTSSNGISLFHLKAAKATGAKVVFTNHLGGLTCSTGKMLYKNQALCNGVISPVKCSVCNIANASVSQTFNDVSGKTSMLRNALSDLKNYQATSFKFLSHYRYMRSKKRKVANLIAIADKFIVLTKWYYKVLEKNDLLNQEVTLIKQGLPSYSVNGNKRNFSSASPLRLIFIGRIFPEKGLHILLSAIKAFDKENLTLDIFGQVDGEEYFQKCKDLAGDNENVKWFPPVSNADVIDTIKKYDVLILPSVISEMAPLVILESWAAGVPVIGTNTGGIAEEIKHRHNGWLFEMGDVNGLRKIISDILEDRAILSEVSSHLSKVRTFKEVAEEVEEVYFSLL